MLNKSISLRNETDLNACIMELFLVNEIEYISFILFTELIGFCTDKEINPQLRMKWSHWSICARYFCMLVARFSNILEKKKEEFYSVVVFTCDGKNKGNGDILSCYIWK